MSTAEPFVAHLREEGSGQWKFELRDLKAFREVLGADVTVAFCRCFVHADRLTSLASLASVSLRQHGSASRALTRNSETVFWFAVGTLHELSVSVRGLCTALALQGLLKSNCELRKELGRLSDRLEKNKFYREMRNSAAFHVDADVIAKGLVDMEAEGNAVLSEGDSEKEGDSSLCLGLNALVHGLDWDEADVVPFVKSVAEDNGVSASIQRVFFLVLKMKRVPIKRVTN